MNKLKEYSRIAALINKFYLEENKDKQVKLFDEINSDSPYCDEYELVKHLDEIEKYLNKNHSLIKLNSHAKFEFESWVFFSFRLQYEYGY